jgi:arylsulfate sulfotransferase
MIMTFALSACGRASSESPSVAVDQTASPFIAFAELTGYDLSSATGVQYTIAPKPGSVSSPVHVEYSIAALEKRGYVPGGPLSVPVYGLYAGYPNQVSLEVLRGSGSPINLGVTSAYTDPTGIYTRPTILTPRAPGSALGFNFVFLKSALGSPIIIDTDGEVRWAATGVSNSISSALVSDTFIIGDPTQPTVYRLGLDGQLTQSPLPASEFTDFNHDIISGKSGLLAEVDASISGVSNLESNVIEFRALGQVSIVNHWDLGAILSAYMTAHGDDAAAFVRPGIDWFHSNSAIYDPSDDSVIVSSRENFVIKLDYRTGAIKWILGDPTKYWYTFPSLRAKALTLAPGGLYPIGQHGLSITPHGLLMLFNDGLGSLNQPSGEPAGQTRTYSAVSAYAIDESAMTAQNVWNYDAGQAIYSEICGSAYLTDDGSLLVDFAAADNLTEAYLIALSPSHSVAFEFEYATTTCNTTWNARPIPLDDLVVTE